MTISTDETILGAFDRPQRLSGSSHLSTRSTSTSLLYNSWEGSSNTSRSPANPFSAFQSPYDSNNSPITSTSSRSRETFLDISREPSIDEATQSATTSHSHWCFVCVNPRVITTCDGWKRHMKEHEMRYRCMPKGPIEYTADGAKCAFCEVRNPSQDHCDTHTAFPCANKSWDVRSYTRKPHFITHLKTHHVSNEAELADHWKDTIAKKHFSCGFCISYFDSLMAQLNHIDVLHYRLFQPVRDWDSNKLIRGLLLQPGVVQSWRRILASHPRLTESLIRWDLSGVKKLQFRLQMGNESADILAEVAFNEISRDSGLCSHFETVDAVGLSYRTPPQQSRLVQATTPVHSNPAESPNFDEDIDTSSPLHTESTDWSSIGPKDFMSQQTQPQPQVNTDVPKLDSSMEWQHPYSNASQVPVGSGGNYRTPQGPNHPASWMSSAVLYPNLTAPHGVVMGDYWQPTSILSPTNSSSTISSPLRYQSDPSVGMPRSRYVDQDCPPAYGHKALSLMQNSGLLGQTSSVRPTEEAIFTQQAQKPLRHQH